MRPLYKDPREPGGKGDIRRKGANDTAYSSGWDLIFKEKQNESNSESTNDNKPDGQPDYAYCTICGRGRSSVVDCDRCLSGNSDPVA